MTRAQRRIHFLVWLVLAPLLLIAYITAWYSRPATPQESGVATIVLPAPVRGAP